MRLFNKELLNEFYEKEKENFPDLDYDTFIEICSVPWVMLRTVMESGTLDEVRIKYFGTFKVYPKRAIGMLNVARENFRRGNLTEKKFNEIEKKITKFLSKHGQS